MKYIGYIILSLTALSGILYSGFSIEWWSPVEEFEIGRTVGLILLHIFGFSVGMVSCISANSKS